MKVTRCWNRTDAGIELMKVLNLSMHCSDVLLFFIYTVLCLCKVLLHLKFRRAAQAFGKTMLVITGTLRSDDGECLRRQP